MANKPSPVPIVIVAEIDREVPLTLLELHAMEQSCTWCLEAHGVELLGALTARSGPRTWLLFRAADVESVRLVARRLNVVTARVWSLAAQAAQA